MFAINAKTSGWIGGSATQRVELSPEPDTEVSTAPRCDYVDRKRQMNIKKLKIQMKLCDGQRAERRL